MIGRRAAVDIFPKLEEFLTRLCTFGVNRSSPGLSIVKSIDGFLKFKTAEGLSQRTITSYEFTLSHWLKYIGDREVSEIQSSDLTGYMAWLRTEYKPVRFNGSKEPLSAKSIRNVWVTFRSFFGWLQIEFKFPNPAKEITAPKFQTHPVETFTKEDVEKILKACVFSRESQTEERKKFVMRRPSAYRDQLGRLSPRQIPAVGRLCLLPAFSWCDRLSCEYYPRSRCTLLPSPARRSCALYTVVCGEVCRFLEADPGSAVYIVQALLLSTATQVDIFPVGDAPTLLARTGSCAYTGGLSLECSVPQCDTLSVSVRSRPPFSSPCLRC